MNTAEKWQPVSSMLSDVDIRHYWKKGIDIYTSGVDALPFDLDKQLQLGSIDLHFRYEFGRIEVEDGKTLNSQMLRDHSYLRPDKVKNGTKIILEPGEIIMTTTQEIVSLSNEFAGIVTGRSSVARLGIMVHCCQEFINPGHGQPIPLQLINMAPCPVELDLSSTICQLVIFRLATPASSSYSLEKDSKYAKEVGPMPSKYHEELPIETADEFGFGKKVKRQRKKSNGSKALIDIFLDVAFEIVVIILISPLVVEWFNGKTVNDLIAGLTQVSLPLVAGLVLLIVYVIFKKKREEME